MADDRVTVSELRRKLSACLQRVERGERLEVTRHGRPVALLEPVGEGRAPIDRSIGAGEASTPSIDILTLLPPYGSTSTKTSDALASDRSGR